jgi:flagellar biosynthetic protein FliR
MDLALAVARPEQAMLTLLWCSLRTGALLAILPAPLGPLLPLRARIGIAGCVGLYLMTAPTPPPVPAELFGPAGLVALAGELLAGLVLALALHAAFAAAVIAGEWIAQASGFAFATVVTPGAAPLPALSMLLAVLLWGLFLSAGGHLLLIQVILQSYAALPAPSALLDRQALSVILGWGGFALLSGILAALPLGAALLLVHLVLAIASRSAPQLNLFAVGLPLMLLAALAGLPLALPGLSAVLSGALAHLQAEAGALLLG